MAIVTLGIDLAKNVFALHGLDAAGRPLAVRSTDGLGVATVGTILYRT